MKSKSAKSSAKKSAAGAMLESMQVPKKKAPPALPPAPAPAALSSVQHRKFSFSLFGTDIAAADKLMDMALEHAAYRANKSDAIKIALRFAAAHMDPETMRETLRAIKAEDGRGRSAPAVR